MSIFMKEDRNFATESRAQLQRKQGRPSTSFKPGDCSVEQVHSQMYQVEACEYQTNMQRSFKALAFPPRETKIPKCKINTLGPAAAGGAFWLQKFGGVTSQMKASYSEESLKAGSASQAAEATQAPRRTGKFDSQFTTKWDDKLYGAAALCFRANRSLLMQVLSQQLQGHVYDSYVGAKCWKGGISASSRH
jgi:hypothetical protein